MFKMRIPLNDKEAFKQWLRTNTVGFWREMKGISYGAEGASLLFELENENDTLRAELTWYGESSLSKPRIHDTTEEEDELEDEMAKAEKAPEISEKDAVLAFLKGRAGKSSGGKVTKSTDPKVLARDNFTNAIALQKKCVALQIEDPKAFFNNVDDCSPNWPTAERTKYEKGQKPKKVYVPVAPWYYKVVNDEKVTEYWLIPRYGSRKVEIIEGEEEILAGPALADVTEVLDALEKATKLGGLDDPLLKAAAHGAAKPKKDKDQPEGTSQSEPKKPEGTEQTEPAET